LTFSLFHGQNRISSKQGINHWIPFSENEVNAPERFDSCFMQGKLGNFGVEENFNSPELHVSNGHSNNGQINLSATNDELFASTQESFVPTERLEFSPQAQAVFEAGRELWQYYFEIKSTPSSLRDATPQEGNLGNPSLYDIKAYFQGQNDGGRMNNKSEDEKYNLLITNLRQGLEVLSFKIQPKVYEFGFLR